MSEIVHGSPDWSAIETARSTLKSMVEMELRDVRDEIDNLLMHEIARIYSDIDTVTDDLKDRDWNTTWEEIDNATN